MQIRISQLAILVSACMMVASNAPQQVTAAEVPADLLRAGFLNPPDSAKPRVWWHWMNGNISQEGIRQDMEWMKRIGIGGVQNFDAAFATPQRVNPRVAFMTPAWQQAFRFAAQTADRLGLEMSIAGSPGWSESGGPWVKPNQAMKKLVWSETQVTGGKRFSGKLANPPSTVGPFQNVPIDSNAEVGGIEAPKSTAPIYADVAVIAFRKPAAMLSMAELQPAVTVSSGVIDGKKLWDGDLEQAVHVAFVPEGGSAWVQYAFDKARTIRAVSLTLPSARGTQFGTDPTKTVAELQSSVDGVQFSTVIEIKASVAVQQTLTFAPITARYFRLILPTPTPARSMLAGLDFGGAAPTEHRLAEWVLHTGARVDRAEGKAAFVVDTQIGSAQPQSASPDGVVRKDQIVDLTARLRADGTLDWQPPAGEWVVLRLGYSLLGINNHPASPEGTGLEVDKLSREHVQSYVSQYLDMYSQFLGADLMGAKGLKGMINDSWEAGAQNWTETLPAEFAKRRGYALLPWLPALTGQVIDSTEATERFLWDFRRTLQEMLAENHYGVIAAALHQRGMIHYAESHEQRRAFIGDGMDVKRFSDVPMSAMWASGLSQDPYDADIRESASVAHLYGQNLVAAESMTAAGNAFAFVPETLKPTADRELAAGLNRFVIHTSVHQPLNEAGPGFTLGPFGQWFTRHETWADQASAWISYLARSSYLLQQGQFVADVLYFYGEDSNITALYGDKLPSIPQGYNYDFVNLQALSLLRVENGQLVTQSGMRYRVLVLDPRTCSMSLAALQRISNLVISGATVIGAKPQASPSLSDSQSAFRAAADAVWGAGEQQGERKHGAGRVISDVELDGALTSLGIAPDFAYTKNASDSNVVFVHRQLSDGELYFVNNRQAKAEAIEASFRVSGKAPELWHADTGRIESVSYRIEQGRTIVPLSLAASDAVFVVFRKPATQAALTVPTVQRTALSTLNGPWELRFAAGQAAPNTARFDQLMSWTQSAEAGIKYYSGTVDYLRDLDVPASWLQQNQRIELDLGEVKNLADVWVNGKSVGTLWKAPFRIDITDALQAGVNKLEVRVTNTWVNRLIGDKQPGAQTYAYATFDPYKADSPLLSSGLLGPVRIMQVVQ